jgi:DNA polymerase III epsilon subunit family exonuclease
MIKENLFDTTFSKTGILYSNYAIFDIETTGLSPVEDDILEVAIVSIKNGKVCDKYHSYVHTSKQISQRITAINKITNSMLIQAPPVGKVINELCKNYSNYIFVGHNAHNFDAKFLLSKASEPILHSIRFLDTKKMAEYILPGLSTMGGYSMKNLCKLFGIQIINQHTAMGDTIALMHLFNRLSRLLENSNDIDKFIISGGSIKL